jgi:tetrapyrrole methylase family protein / MazG family protein
MAKTEKITSFEKITGIIKGLRKECPWDRKQTHRSLRKSLIEETYEVIEAIEKGDDNALKQELGDLLLNIIMHSVIAEEKKKFTIDDVISSVSEKMIRRHPHVFGKVSLKTPDEVKNNWEKIKLTEGKKSVIEGVPRKMPALLRSHRIQSKAARVGFDWTHKKQVWQKVAEEISELKSAERSNEQRSIEEEFGDLLFALVNYSRFIGVNPEFALHSAVGKFTRRFNQVEKEIIKRGKKIGEVSLKEMDGIWEENKRKQS